MGVVRAMRHQSHSHDTRRTFPGPPQDHESAGGDPLSCQDVADGGVPGTRRPASQAPAPTPQPAFGVGESVLGAHGDRHNVLPRLGHPGAQASVTLPATQHVTRVPGAEQQLRAPLGGQGRGLRGTAGLVAEGGRRRTARRSSEPQGSREPCVFRGRNFLWCPRAVHRSPTDHGATRSTVFSGQDERGRGVTYG